MIIYCWEFSTLLDLFFLIIDTLLYNLIIFQRQILIYMLLITCFRHNAFVRAPTHYCQVVMLKTELNT